MKILCSYSGVEFNCEHFPGYFTSRETHHPVFNLPQKKLLGTLKKWAEGGLTATDSYLLFLALLNSSELVQFRVPAERGKSTDAIVANNLENLATTVTRLNAVSAPSVTFPHYVISPETKHLDNVKYWIENWNNAYKDFASGKSRDYDNRKLVQREAALARMIKNPHRPITSYAGQIADWAVVAGDFPESLTPNPYRANEQIPLSAYWRELIVRAAGETQMFTIDSKDLAELQEHCEMNIPAGTIYSSVLFKMLARAKERTKNFLGFDDLDIGNASGHYRIIDSADQVEAANLQSLIDSAPDHEPKPEEYPTKFAFMKAQMRWKMSVRYNGKAPDSLNDDSIA